MASYTVSGYSADAVYLIVTRKSPGGRCTTVTFANPGAELEEFPLDVSTGASLVNTKTQDGPCGAMDMAPTRAAIGALGSFELLSPGSYCAFRFDFTLFFLTEHGTVDPVRFHADRVLFVGKDDDDC